jgi:hypothetical protein
MAIDRVYRVKCDFPRDCWERLYRISGGSSLRNGLLEAGWLTVGSLNFCGPGHEWQPDRPAHHAAQLGGHRAAHRKTGQKDFARRQLIQPGCDCGWRGTGQDRALRVEADDDWLHDHLRTDVLGLKSRQQERDELRQYAEKAAQRHVAA